MSLPDFTGLFAGGATYHQRFKTFEFIRGQEGDKWKGQVTPPELPPEGDIYTEDFHNPKSPRREILVQDLINRQFIPSTKDMPQHKTFDLGLEFLERNVDEDRFYLGTFVAAGLIAEALRDVDSRHLLKPGAPHL